MWIGINGHSIQFNILPSIGGNVGGGAGVVLGGVHGGKVGRGVVLRPALEYKQNYNYYSYRGNCILLEGTYLTEGKARITTTSN